MKFLLFTYLLAVMWSSSLYGATYYFTGNVTSQADLSSQDIEYVAFNYDSVGKINGYNTGAYNSVTSLWYNLGSNSGDGRPYDDVNVLANYAGGSWEQTSADSGQGAFVSLDNTLGTNTIDEWRTVGGKAVSLNSNITTGEDFLTLWGAHSALRIGNGSDDAVVDFNRIRLRGWRDSILIVSQSATLEADELEMNGYIHDTSQEGRNAVGRNPDMLFHVSGAANIGTLKLSSKDVFTSKDTDITATVPTESMVHIESTGRLKVDTLTLDTDDSETAVIKIEDGGILELTNNTQSVRADINSYMNAGGIFSASSNSTLNVYDIDGGSLYVTTLERSQIPEPAHVTLVMGLFALLYLPLSARKVAI